MQSATSDITYEATSGKRSVYVTTDGGIFRTNDIASATGSNPLASPTPIVSQGWSQLNQTYQTTQFYSVAGDGSSGVIYGGTQDNGTLRLVGENTDAPDWVLGGDGGKVDVDGTYCYGQGGAHNNQMGHLWRAANCDGSPTPTPILISGGISDYNDVGVWLAPIIIDPSSTGHERAFFGASSVWRTDNVKTGSPPTWTNIKPNPSVTPSPGGTSEYRPRVSAMAIAPSDSNYMWVGEWFPDRIEASGN